MSQPDNATRTAADRPVEVAVLTVKITAFQHTTAQPGTVEPWQKEGEVVVIAGNGIRDDLELMVAPGGRGAGIVPPDRKRR